MSPIGSMTRKNRRNLVAVVLVMVCATYAGSEPARVGEPYELLGKRLVFTNWIYIRPGDVGWYNEEGQAVNADESVEMDAFAATWKPTDRMPWGIRLRAMKPESVERWSVEPKYPWEGSSIHITSILEEDGILKAWGNCAGGDCYLESKDGYEWERPTLGLVEYQGSKENNLIPQRPPGQVFVDPTSEERYKCIWTEEGVLTKEDLEAFKIKYPDRWGPRVYREVDGIAHIVCVFGWTSKDGFHWNRLPEPVLMEHCDSYNIAYYDTRFKKYVAYVRTWNALERAPSLPVEEGRWDYWLPNARRSIARAETEDFSKFPRSEMVLEPGPEMAPTDGLYYNCFTWVPGGPDQLLMFPAIRHLHDDTTTIAMAVTANGKNWHWAPEGRELIETGPYGRWDGGCIWPHPPLFERGDGSFALRIRGDNFPHKYPRGLRKIEHGLAVWPHGRIMALEAPVKGEFATVAIVPKGTKLYINALTKRSGSIRVAVQKGFRGASLLEGRDFRDCIPIVGDQPHTLVRWKDAEDLGVASGEPVILLFQMEQASIFALEFE